MKNIAATVLAAAACASATSFSAPSVPIVPSAHPAPSVHSDRSVHPVPSAHSAHPVPSAHSASAMKANATTIWVTETVGNFTTFIPGPTVFSYGNQTVTVDKPTTVTVTDCPCTITRPITYVPNPSCTECPPNVLPTPPCTENAPPAPGPTNPLPNPATAVSRGITTLKDNPINPLNPHPSQPNHEVPNTGVVPPPTRVPGGPSGSTTPSRPASAGAGKLAAVSGALLAGVVGLFALAL